MVEESLYILNRLIHMILTGLLLPSWGSFFRDHLQLPGYHIRVRLQVLKIFVILLMDGCIGLFYPKMEIADGITDEINASIFHLDNPVLRMDSE